jgi:acyl-CoA thioester hydrolase
MTVDFGHVETVSVHFDDLDAMGVVHNARYAVLVERAFTTYWSRLGFGYAGMASPPDFFSVVGEFSISYRVPVRVIGELGIHLWTEWVGTTSAAIGFRVLSADGQTVHAEGRRVNIKLDPTTMRPSPWSEKARVLATAMARPIDPGDLDDPGPTALHGHAGRPEQPVSA